MKKEQAWLFAALAGFMLLTGCAHMAGGIASSNIPLEGRKYITTGETRGTSSRVRLFGILPVSGSNSLREALKDAQRRGNADALINITVENFRHDYILFSRDVTMVEATAVRFVP